MNRPSAPLLLSLVLASTLLACAHDPAPAPIGTAPPPPSPATCPSAWTAPPTVDPKLQPSDAAHVVVHAAAKGTQNYACTAPDAGAAPAWALTGPEASLADCNGAVTGQHFASEGGPTAPKWQATDGSWVVGAKVAAVPGEAGAVPWLLLRAASVGGQGALARVTYVQRTGTSGGAAPATGCDAQHVGATVKVPYSADYWFLAP